MFRPSLNKKKNPSPSPLKGSTDKQATTWTRPQAGHEFNGYRVTEEWFTGSANNVCKAIRITQPEDEQEENEQVFALKFFKTAQAYKHEANMLSQMKGAKNVVQLIEAFEEEKVIVLEYGLCDLQTFIRKPTWIKSPEQLEDIKKHAIKNIVNGLEECHRKGIVHTNLTPKNIVLFQDPSVNTSTWKLIDFDASRRLSSPVSVNTVNYCSPEVAKFIFTNKCEKADPSIDMFAFGLVLYFMETGHHYWKRRALWFAGPPLTKIEKLEILRSDQMLSVSDRDDIDDEVKRGIINKLLERTKPKKQRMTLEAFKQSEYYPKSSANNQKIIDAIAIEKREEQRYQEMMKLIPNEWKKISPKLFNLHNDKIPRLFIVIPLIPSWKNRKTWDDNSFQLYFACEHATPHIPQHAGYPIQNPGQFIKKFVSYIKLCHHLVSAEATSETFPPRILEQMGKLLHERNSAGLYQEIGKIGDALDSLSKEMPEAGPEKKVVDELTDESEYKIVNETGLKSLREYLGTKTPFANLTQARLASTGDKIWVCPAHSQLYESPSPTISVFSTKPTPTPPEPAENRIDEAKAIIRDILQTAKMRPESLDRFKTNNKKALHFVEIWLKDTGIGADEKKRLEDALENFTLLLLQLLNFYVHHRFVQKANKPASWTHKGHEIRKLQKMYRKNTDNLVIKLCQANERVSSIDTSKVYNATAASAWITGINELSSAKFLDNYEDRCLPLSFFRQSYVPTCKISELDVVNARKGTTFCVTKTKVNGDLIAEKKILKKEQTYDIELLYSIEKEVYLFKKYFSGKCDNIIGFRGTAIKDGKPVLLLEWAQDGNLNEYMRTYKCLDAGRMTWKWKLSVAKDVTRAVHFLHKNGILHLSIQSHNVLLTSNHHAKLSNFLWSQKYDDHHTFVQPQHYSPRYHYLRERWLDPQKLAHPHRYQLSQKSDIYSLAVLFWEIADGRGSLPYEEVGANGIRQWVVEKKRRENLPKNMNDHWRTLVERMWRFELHKRPEIEEVLEVLEGIIYQEINENLNGENEITDESKYWTWDEAIRTHEKHDFGNAVKAFKFLAEKSGRAEAWDYLAKYYRDGCGVEPDMNRAVEYFLKGAKKHNKDRRNVMSENEIVESENISTNGEI